ncbi:MAG: ABC transporter ATP-binding protein [Nitrospira sp.]|nr:ABC transporter ATP-binding protein [Nitrospira sp.]
MIELHNVSKIYQGVGSACTALNCITLRFSAGEFAAIVGKSGSGKSTLLNMLTGIDHPSTGTVVINGTEVHTLNESDLASWRGRNIGIVFQFFQLIPTLTVIENILLAMDLVSVIPKSKRQARAENLLKQVGIDRHADQLPAALSGGEQQRAAIARALANDPPILVADEPTGNLDSVTSEVILKLLRELADSGKTVIVVTHDPSASARFERLVTLKDGRIESDQAKAVPS